MKSPTNKPPLDVIFVKYLDKVIARFEKSSRRVRYPIASLIIIIGIVLLVMPGPGILFIVTGLAMISKPFGAFVTKHLERYITWRQKKR